MKTTLFPARDCEVFLVRGDSREALVREAKQLRSSLGERPDEALVDIARAINTRSKEDRPLCLSIVSSSREDLDNKLSRAIDRLSDPETHEIKSKRGIYFFERPLYPQGKLAFLFPGEGSQYPYMLADLCILFPEVRAHFDRIDRAFDACGLSSDFLTSELVFPRSEAGPPGGGPTETQGLWRMSSAVAAVLTANQAVLDLLSRLRILPDCVLGHSTGEYTALQAAGLLEVSDPSRYQLYISELHRIYREAMARGVVERVRLVAAGADAQTVRSCLDRIGADLHLAMDNCPHQVVFLGAEREAERASRELGEKGIICQDLPFDRPYHTPLFRAYAEELRPFFEKWITGSACLPVYSCTIADRFPADRPEICRIAVEHWARPVRFRETIEKMYADGVRIFLESGPRGNLSSFVSDILGKREGLALAANITGRSGWAQIHHAVGLLAAQGVPLSTERLYAGRPSLRPVPVGGGGKQKEELPPMRIELELPRLRLDPAASRRRPPPPASTTQTAAPGESSSSSALAAYFSTMERFLAVQREVMATYCTGTPEGETTDAAYDFPKAFSELLRERDAAVEALGEGIAESLSALSARLPIPGRNPEEGLAGTVPTQPFAEDGQSGLSGEPMGISPEGLKRLLLVRISERTGYPMEMLDPKVDLEADLGIDSIKRIEILGSLWESSPGLDTADLEEVAGKKTLGAMIASLVRLAGLEDDCNAAGEVKTSGCSPVSGKEALADAVSRLPLIDEILSFSPGKALIAKRTFDPGRDIFLKDHTIGRRISATEPERTALPVLPLTMSMEMMAEAASLLVPDGLFLGMKAFRGHRWIFFDPPPVTLEVIADRPREDEHVHVRIFEKDRDPASGALPFAEGTVLFGTEYPPPETRRFSLQKEKPSRWDPDRLYEERMFHGPCWQGVSSMDRSGEDGSVATLQVLAWDGFFSPPRPGSFLTDPVVLDAAGQVVGFWAMEHLEEGFLVFPYRFEALHVYGPRQEVGQRLTCLARTRLEGSQKVLTDFDVLCQNGRPWMRLEGWEDKRFRLPERVYAFLLSPIEIIAGEAWEGPFSSFRESSQLCCLRLNELCKGDEEFWTRVFGSLILTPKERRAFRHMGLSRKDSIDWLLGRLLAKDAVRLYLRRNNGPIIGPADVEIKEDERGRLVPDGPWAGDLDKIPFLCLAHAEGLTAAVAGNPRENRSFGIDIERLPVSQQDLNPEEFLPEERELLHSMNGVSKEEWLLRSRSAKEAAARALGLEHRGSLLVQNVDPFAGEVKLGLDRELGRSFPDLADRPIRVRTLREAHHIVASTVIQGSRHDPGNP